uniref:Ribosomal protein S8 n=1 Tax=Prototheca zopfii TaxID=3112 RepID=A0A2P1G7P1_9CHLO|nr:ribosomal protein S8 [Prototheca ciferrii]AVM80977.1 ribosomal protein S8 [Prototheca ciferrii]
MSSSLTKFQTAIITLKNNLSIKKKLYVLPYTKLIKTTLILAQNAGFIRNVLVVKLSKTKKIILYKQKYVKNKSLINNIVFYSKPGKRFYIKKKNIKNLPNRQITTYILSTNKGVLTDEEAILKNVGGELLISFN